MGILNVPFSVTFDDTDTLLEIVDTVEVVLREVVRMNIDDYDRDLLALTKVTLLEIRRSCLLSVKSKAV